MGAAVSGKSSEGGDSSTRNDSEPPSHVTSQGFYPPPDPAVLRRSLILSGSASAFGAMFFTLIQGTVFNFFLEDLSLREQLPYFMSLWFIGGLGNLLGSWLQERYGCRKAIFLVTVGGSRLIWLAIGLIPILWPEMREHKSAMQWLSVLVFLFYFTHSIGVSAWLSWMADLVPKNLQGRYWSLRQVGTSLSGVLARVAAGYFLEPYHCSHNMLGYAIVFGGATLCGMIDACMFIGVVHRRPKLRQTQHSVFTEFKHRLMEVSFRRLCIVYVLWNVANSIMGPTCFYFMRDQVGMGVAQISICEALSLIGFTAFSLLWGKFTDSHGHRGALVLCILVQALAPIFYFPAKHGDVWLIGLTMALGSIGFCGIQLFMMPLVIRHSKGSSGGREVGIAAFNVVMAVANFIALNLTEKLFESLAWILNTPPHHTRVFLGVMALAMLIRLIAAGIASLLPEDERETPTGTVITQVVMTNPLRATVGLIRYVVGKEEWEHNQAEEKTSQDVASKQ